MGAMTPTEITDLEIAFPAHGLKLLPAWEDIPDEFKTNGGKHEQLLTDWFFAGIKLKSVEMKEGIDQTKAFRHLKCIMGSYEPKHEHKMSGVAYLIEQWFESIEYEATG